MIIPTLGDLEADTVTVTVDEYMTLLQEVKFLRYLEQFGIQEWEGFEQAVNAWRDNE